MGLHRTFLFGLRSYAYAAAGVKLMDFVKHWLVFWVKLIFTFPHGVCVFGGIENILHICGERKQEMIRLIYFARCLNAINVYCHEISEFSVVPTEESEKKKNISKRN